MIELNGKENNLNHGYDGQFAYLNLKWGSAKNAISGIESVHSSDEKQENELTGNLFGNNSTYQSYLQFERNGIDAITDIVLFRTEDKNTLPSIHGYRKWCTDLNAVRHLKLKNKSKASCALALTSPLVVLAAVGIGAYLSDASVTKSILFKTAEECGDYLYICYKVQSVSEIRKNGPIKVLNVNFDLVRQQLREKVPQNIVTEIFTNKGSILREDNLDISESITETTTFSHTHGFEVKVGTEIEWDAGVQVPLLGKMGGTFNFSTEFGYAHSRTSGQDRSETKEYKRSLKVQVPPFTKVTATAVLWKQEMEIPYTLDMQLCDGEVVQSSGLWKGVSAFNLEHTVEEEKLKDRGDEKDSENPHVEKKQGKLARILRILKE